MGTASTNSIASVKDAASELLKLRQPIILAIDGYGGAGKTTLANQLHAEFPGSSIITLDAFATDTESGADRNRFISQVLEPLAQGNAARYQRFDWQQQALSDWIEVKPSGLIIIEGVSVLGDDFLSYYDLKIWIDCPTDLALQRIKDRDKDMHDPKWFNVWEKEDKDYGRTEPWKKADIILPVAF